MDRLSFVDRYSAKYPRAFLNALWFVLDAEGGFKRNGGLVNDSNDRGGLTKYGISSRAFPKLNIAALTLDKAVHIYFARYWRPIRASELPPYTAIIAFDASVQHGYIMAGKMLQEMVGSKVDGIVGRNTIAKAKAAHDLEIATSYIIRRCRFYARIIKRKNSQGKFLEGWFNRMKNINNFIWRCRLTAL